MADSQSILPQNPTARMTVLERGAYVIIVGAIAGLLGWIGVSLTEGQKTTARLEIKVEYLSDQVAEIRDDIKGAGQDRYTSRDAARDLSDIRSVLSDHENRIRRIEQGGAPGR